MALREELRRQLGVDWPPEWANDLARTYTNRSNARRAGGGDLAGDRADCDAAIALREELHRQLGVDWPPEWANDLANVYMNRGVTRGDSQDLSGALTDYGQAIELQEALRERLGAEWPPG